MHEEEDGGRSRANPNWEVQTGACNYCVLRQLDDYLRMAMLGPRQSVLTRRPNQ